ncbi:MAG: phosphoribosyltransferase family protein [bacterium]|nr:phosphoribosyltransferase family protein [bacterium]
MAAAIKNSKGGKMDKEKVKEIFADAQTIITGDHFVYAKKADGWYHGGEYVNKDAIYPFTRFVSPLCKDIAEHFLGRGIEVVVGPTVGGVSLSQWTAHWYAPYPYKKEVLAVYADEEDVLEHRVITGDELRKLGISFGFVATGEVSIKLKLRPGPPPVPAELGSITYTARVGTRRILKRGYDKIVKGQHCLVVEDVINTGLTVKKTVDAIKLAGGTVVGVGALCNRSGGKVTAEFLGVPELFSLLNVDMKMYREEECLICKERGPQSVRTDIGKGKEFLIRSGITGG